MRYVAAYLLAALGGNNNPSEKDLEKIIGSVGIEAEADKLKKIISELKGKNIEDLIKAGEEKLATVPSGGGGAAPAAAAAPAGGAAPAAAAGKKEEKKKPEPESESDEDMGFGLFD